MDSTSTSGFASQDGPQSQHQPARAGAHAPGLFEFADFGQLTLDPFPNTFGTTSEADANGVGSGRPGMHRIPTHHSSHDDADSEHHARLIDRAAAQPRTSSSDRNQAPPGEQQRPGSSLASGSRPPPSAPSAAAAIDYTSRTFARRLSSGRMSHGRFSSIGSLRGAAQAQDEANAAANGDASKAESSSGVNGSSGAGNPLPRPPSIFPVQGSVFHDAVGTSSTDQVGGGRRPSAHDVIEYQRRQNPDEDEDGLAEAEALAASSRAHGDGSSPGANMRSTTDVYDESSYAPKRASRSSFFGLDAPAHGGSTDAAATRAEQIAAYHRGQTNGSPGGALSPGGHANAPTDAQKPYRQSMAPLLAQGITGPAPQAVAPGASSPTAGGNGVNGSYGAGSGPSSYGGAGQSAAERGMGGLGPSGSTRPPSIAPTVNSSFGGTVGSIYGAGMLLDHRHLQPGKQAALLSHEKTLELYRNNAKKTNDPTLIYEFAVFMIDAAKSMAAGEAEEGKLAGAIKDGALAAGSTANGNSRSGSPVANNSREELVKEAIGLLKRIADRGHADAQYFLADCYANGIGTPKGRHDFDRAYPLFVLAAKHGHPDAAYRAGTCYEKGWGCRKDAGKALQFYRKAASPGDAGGHPGAMYRLATAELNGELGCKKSAKEGVKWLKRSAEAATPEFPHALHELALLHERGIDNVLFVDPEYSCELLAQAAELGYAPSAYKLGVNYEYGRMGCPQDAGLSIHMYNIAAQQGHKEACFALTAWYLVGAPGILPQSDTEAYLWAKKAAEQGLGKAEYAVGYFTEMGIGTVKDLHEAKAWYKRAQEHGDKRANQRLAALGSSNGIGLGFGLRKGNGPAPNKAGTAAQAYSNAQEQGERQRALREQQQQQYGAEEDKYAALREDARSARERERERTQSQTKQARNKRRFDFVAPPQDMRVSQYILPDAEQRAAAAAAAQAAAAANRQSMAPSERPMSQMPMPTMSMQEMRMSGYGNSFGAPGPDERKLSSGPSPTSASAAPMFGPGGAGGGGGPRPALPPGAGQTATNPYRKSSLPPPGPGMGMGATPAYPTYEPGQSILRKPNPSASPPPPPASMAARAGWTLDTQFAAGARPMGGPSSAGPGPGPSPVRGPGPGPGPGFYNGGGGSGAPGYPPGTGGYRGGLPPGAGPPGGGGGPPRLPGSMLPPQAAGQPQAPAGGGGGPGGPAGPALWAGGGGDGKKNGGWFHSRS